MVLIDWVFHVYLAALSPSVHAFSYVDKISEAGHVVMDVVAAFFSTICFFQLWGLSLDQGKTYFWSTSAVSRDLLRLLGLSQQREALDLGGSMTFDAKRRTRLLRSRGDKLQDTALAHYTRSTWCCLRHSGPRHCMVPPHAQLRTATCINCAKLPTKPFDVKEQVPVLCRDFLSATTWKRIQASST